MNTTFASHHKSDVDEDINDKHIFLQTSSEYLSKDLFLLYNQGTLDQFINNKYLTNIHKVVTPITVFCNVGYTSTNLKRKFESFSVWYNPKGITNVQSLKTVTDYYLVSYNSNDRGGLQCTH